MQTLFWIVVLLLGAACLWIVRIGWRRWDDNRRAEEARMAAFVSGLASPKPAPTAEPPAPVVTPANGDVAVQRLLFDAAHKAGEAGEPALAIQLYARLLARYPSTSFAEPARAAAAALKKKLAKA
jgi:hypothetical protein